MTVSLLHLPLNIIGAIINYLESNKDLHSFTLTCTVLTNCVKLERLHFSLSLCHYENRGKYALVALVAPICRTFERLQSLEFRNCEKISDVDFLYGFTKISSLSLYDCKELIDVSALAGLKMLSALVLEGGHRLKDISSIG